jgi:hypothetical protein
MGRVKILLTAFLILGLCLLFFKKNKEGFTATSRPPDWGAGAGYGEGDFGTIIFRMPETFKIVTPQLYIGTTDGSGNDITSLVLDKLSNINGSLTSSAVILTIQIYVDNKYYYSYVQVTSVNINLFSSGSTLSTPYYKLNFSVLDKNDPITQLAVITTGAQVKISWRSFPECAITPWSTHNKCIPTTCDTSSSLKPGTISNDRFFIRKFGRTDQNGCGVITNRRDYPLTRTESCTTSEPCYPVNCVPGEWNSGQCIPRPGGPQCELQDNSKSGLETETRIIRPALHGGTCSAEDSVTTRSEVPCSLRRCNPTNCRPGAWTSSSQCIPVSGGPTCESNDSSRSGRRTETRTIEPPVDGGICPPADSVTTRTDVPCALNRCPINCVPGAWSNSGTCSNVPGGRQCETTTTSLSGSQMQIRSIQRELYGGICTSENSATTKFVPCSLSGCPTNCIAGSWSNSGTCSNVPDGPTCENSATSLSGKQLKVRTMIPPTNGGSCADPRTNDTIDCALSTRCPINCITGAWSNSGRCVGVGGSNCEPSETSRSGLQTQTRSFEAAQFNGTCTESNTSQVIQCALSSRCPIPCELSTWSNIGTCQQPTSNIECEPTTTSQSGFQRQFQTIATPARFNGSCPISGSNTSNVRTVACRLTNIPQCKNPFADTSLVNLQTISYNDVPMFGTFPYNDVRLTQDNIGDTTATIFKNEDGFKNYMNGTCV